MAVPKKRVSKARKHSRRANWKLTLPGIVTCPQCHEPKLPHRVCAQCGYYDGRPAIEVEDVYKRQPQRISPVH